MRKSSLQFKLLFLLLFSIFLLLFFIYSVFVTVFFLEKPQKCDSDLAKEASP